MKELAVTGSNGMTGSHMVSLLDLKGYSVKKITRNEWNLEEWKSFEEFDNIFGSPLGIFHFGAKLPDKKNDNGNKNTQNIFNINIRSCLNLGEWAMTRNIPIIFLSSAVVYENPHATKIVETELRAINNLGGYYGLSKILAESIFNNLAKYGLKCIIFRPSSIYGHGLQSEKIIQNYLNLALQNKDLIINEPKNKINFIHAYDVVNAALRAYEVESWGTFNIASDEKNTISELVKIIINVTGSNSKIVLKDNNNKNTFSRFDLESKLAKKSFGFQSNINLEKGIQLMKKKMLMPC